MPTRAHHSASESAYGPYEAEGDGAYDELWPGERNVPLPSGAGRKAVLRGVIILTALGGGWALLSDRASWPDWQSIETTVTAWMTPNARAPTAPATLALATASAPARTEPPAKPMPLETPPSIDLSKSGTAPGSAAKFETPPQPTASLPQTAPDSGKTEASPLPPPAADPADPYSIRAEAVGLHPDLSRVLLARLSPADYRNAGIAIKTALAETPDTAVLTWPRQRKPELALFNVRFVQGAAPGCRRYVVTITMDGWLTTALPMEKCGSQPRRAQAK